MKKNTKPEESAFPHAINPNSMFGQDGLTKREMFAVHAMLGILAATDSTLKITSVEAKAFVNTAILCADELIKRLEKTS